MREVARFGDRQRGTWRLDAADFKMGDDAPLNGTIGEAEADTDDLLNASLRMRPDRVILGEIRGREAYTFLRAINTGHPGSMSTIHADTPDRAVEQLALLVLQTGTRLSRSDIVHYVRSTIDIFVQLDRYRGKRQISAIKLSSDKWRS